MAKITFGQITLEDSNKSLQELVQIYKGLFINEEFALPLISAVADIEELPEEYDEDDDEGVEEEIEKPVQPQQPQQPAPGPVTGNNLY